MLIEGEWDGELTQSGTKYTKMKNEAPRQNSNSDAQAIVR